MFEKVLYKNAVNIIILLLIIVGLLFFLTKFGVVHCSSLPGWCDIYWSIAGKPTVLVVSGDDGLGDAQLLVQKMEDPAILNINPAEMHISEVSSGNLSEYTLVIVTHAKTISTDKLEAFEKYVENGGRLVWIGDAGTKAPSEDEYWYKDDEDINAPHEKVGGWVRKNAANQKVDFGKEILAAEYIGNYCDFTKCNNDHPMVGIMTHSDDPLVQGLKPQITLQRNFALVHQLEYSTSGPIKTVASVTTDSAVIHEGKNYGRHFPIILRVGAGGRVAYYALPPEEYLDPKKGETWTAFLQNLYWGMVT